MQSQSSSPGIVGNNLGQGTFSQYNSCVLPPADDRRDLSEAASKLYERVAVAAIHNSADQGTDAPRCDPQTREAVQQDIHSRLTHPGDRGGHIWLTGPAGTGKTAIVGSVCDKLQTERCLAASFYFSSHKSSRNRKSKKNFVTTLAHQLQRLDEHISTRMLSAIRREPEILAMTLGKQAEDLILQPFRDAQPLDPSSFNSPWILAVDGVDECEEDDDTGHNQSRQKSQLEVLRACLALASDPSFPCRIIIASRPEPWIRRFFEGEAVGRFKEMFLGENYDPDADIRLYYQSHFSRISRRCEYNTSEWPEEEDMRNLVENASGQFIYAATVIRFVDSSWPLPKDQLKMVLEVKTPAAGSNPLDALDELYTTIIKKCSPCPDITIVWLQGIVFMGQMTFRRKGLLLEPRTFIDLLFESSEGQAKAVVALPSLISRDGNYNFYHKSFVDYLEDTGRSGLAFPGVDGFPRWLAERFAKVLECTFLRSPFLDPSP